MKKRHGTKRSPLREKTLEYAIRIYRLNQYLGKLNTGWKF